MANSSVYSLLKTSRSLVGLAQDLEFLGSQERRLTEEVVWRRTQELAEFLEAARVGLKSIGPAGTILWANQFELEMLGYAWDEYIGHHVQEFIADPEVVAEIVRELNGGLGLDNLDACIRCKDGSFRNVLLDLKLFGDGSTDAHLWCSTRDITSRRLAEGALRQSEEQFRMLVSHVKEFAIFGLDVAGIVQNWNEGAELLKGYTANEIIGQSFTRFYPPEAIAAGAPAEHLRRAIVEGHYVSEGWRVRKDGSRFWAEAGLTALRDEAGRLRGFSKVTRDLTARRVAEIVARRNERRLDDAQKLAHLGSWDWDIQTDDLTWSDETYRLFGLQPQEWQMTFPKFFAMVYPDDKSHLQAAITQTMNDKLPRGLEIRIKPATGGIRTVFSQWALTCNPAGTPIRLGGTALDITDRKLIEAELTTARRVAEGASRAKSEFLAKMSHEIRTPMNGIIGMADLLLSDRTLTAEQREWMSIVKLSADALLTIVNDILDFSKVEAGVLELRSSEFSVRNCVINVISLLQGKAAEKNLELRWFVASDVPQMIRNDEGRLRQVLLNLISNGIKFTDSGSVTVEVSLIAARLPQTLEFGVRDTGIGIPPEKHRMIFDPFIQADNSTTRRFGGTGLGLTICAQLVEVMGGRIWVESTLGDGSIFRFTIPSN